MQDFSQFDLEKSNAEEQVLTLRLLSEPNSCGFTAGLSWLSQSFKLLFQRFGTWFLMGLAILGCLIGVGILAAIIDGITNNEMASLAVSMLNNVAAYWFMGGLVIAAASLAEEGDLQVKYVFSGFQFKLAELALLFAIFMLFSLLLMGVVFLTIWLLKDWIVLAIFLSTLFILPLMLAGWLAMPLVVLHDIKPLDAMKMSLSAGVKNIMALIGLAIFGALFFSGVGLVVMLTIAATGVAPSSSSYTIVWVVLVPTLLLFSALAYPFNAIMTYVAYRDIWTNLPMELK